MHFNARIMTGSGIGTNRTDDMGAQSRCEAAEEIAQKAAKAGSFLNIRSDNVSGQRLAHKSPRVIFSLCFH